MQEIISKQIDTLLLNALINSIQSQKPQYVWKDYSGYKIASKKPPEKIPYFMASSESGKPTIESCQTFSFPGSYSQRDKMYKCEQNDYFQPIIQKAIEKTSSTESLLSKNVKSNIRHKVYMKILNLEKRERTKPIPEDEIKELEHIGENIANSLHTVYESKGMAGALWLDRLLKDEEWVNYAVINEFDKLYPRKITSEPERRAYEKHVLERDAVLSKAKGKAQVKIQQKQTVQVKRAGKSLTKADQMMLFGNGDKPINIYKEIPGYKGYRFLSHDDGKTRYNLGLYRHEEAINLFEPYIRKSIQVERLPYGFSIRASAESRKPFYPEFKPTKSLKAASRKTKKMELPDWMIKGYKPKQKPIEPKQMTLFGSTKKPKRESIIKKFSAPGKEYVIEEILDKGHSINPDGTIVLYHATTKENAKKIKAEGILKTARDAPDNYGIYLSTSPDVVESYGDGTLVKIRVKARDLNPDDVFPNNRIDFQVTTRQGRYKPIGTIEIVKSGKRIMPLEGLTEKGRKQLQSKVHLWGMRLYNKYGISTGPKTIAGKQLEELSYALADRLISEYGPNELVIGNKISKKIQNLDWLDDQLTKQWEIENAQPEIKPSKPAGKKQGTEQMTLFGKQ